MPVRLYVGNLPKEEVDRQELHSVFAEAGDFVSTKVIKDRKTGICRGFGFVTVETDEQADQIIEKFNGYMFKEAELKIEKALPRTKSKAEEETASPVANSGNTSTAPAPTPSAGGGSNSGRRNNKKSRRGGSTTSSSSTNSDGFQPDPRWADELAKLKEMLAAQTSNS